MPETVTTMSLGDSRQDIASREVATSTAFLIDAVAITATRYPPIIQQQSRRAELRR